MNTLSVCMIVQNESFWIKPCIESVLPIADEIVIVDGGSKDGTIEAIEEIGDARIRLFHNKWKDDWAQQREFAVREARYDWCLQLDADECLSDDIWKIPEAIESGKSDVYDLQYKHPIYSFGFLDATQTVHVGKHRLFRNKGVYYKPRMHELAYSNQWKSEISFFLERPIIWHFGYLDNVASVIKKYSKHKKYSETHSAQFLVDWKQQHCFGLYPVKQATQEELDDLPGPIKELLKP